MKSNGTLKSSTTVWVSDIEKEKELIKRKNIKEILGYYSTPLPIRFIKEIFKTKDKKFIKSIIKEHGYIPFYEFLDLDLDFKIFKYYFKCNKEYFVRELNRSLVFIVDKKFSKRKIKFLFKHITDFSEGINTCLDDGDLKTLKKLVKYGALDDVLDLDANTLYDLLYADRYYKILKYILKLKEDLL